MVAEIKFFVYEHAHKGKWTNDPDVVQLQVKTIPYKIRSEIIPIAQQQVKIIL